MQIILCDDNPNDLNDIKSVLIDCNYKDSYSLKSFQDPWDLLYYFEDNREIDVIFLDILMPKISGIEIAKKLRKSGFDGFIVLLSSSNAYATQSYNVNAFTYLLKPPEKYVVQSVIEKIEQIQTVTKNCKFKIKLKNGERFISFSELMYIEVKNHHLYFNLHNEEIIRIYGKLSDYSDLLLADSRMVQGNRSFILNMDYINRCENGAVLIKNGVWVSIPKGFTDFQSHYLNWMFEKKEYVEVQMP